jgi:selenocysteine insertion sequence-binding protein 2
VAGKRVLDKVPKIPNAKVVREYVDQPLDAELNELVTLLLGELMKYQERARQKDAVKAKTRRRLVFGLREVICCQSEAAAACIVVSSPTCE